MDQSRSNLTFGLELEFIIQYRLSEYPSLQPFLIPPSSNGARAKTDTTILAYHARHAVGEHVLAVLHNAGFDTYGFLGAGSSDSNKNRYEHWLLTQDGSIQTPSGSASRRPPGRSTDDRGHTTNRFDQGINAAAHAKELLPTDDRPADKQQQQQPEQRRFSKAARHRAGKGVPNEVRRTPIEANIRMNDGVDDWASLGFELISPILDYDSTEWRYQIGHLLNSLD
ncbi:MAG: hypothetical protein M4579_004872, partial [Chaenotheca gracillima]